MEACWRPAGCRPSSTNGLPRSREDRYGAGVRPITEDQFLSESTSILRDVQSGQSMIVTRNGTAVAEPKPVAAPRHFLARAVIAQAAITAPRVDAARFRADIDRARGSERRSHVTPRAGASHPSCPPASTYPRRTPRAAVARSMMETTVETISA